MGVIKVVEIVGGSPDSFEEAVKHALKSCCQTVRNVVGLEVINWTCKIEDGKIAEYKANCKIAFVVEDNR